MMDGDDYSDEDVQKQFEELFDPEKLDEWLRYSSEEFMLLIVHEIRMHNERIRWGTNLLNGRSCDYKQLFERGELTEDYCLNLILKSSKRIDRLLDVMRAFAHSRE